MCIISFYCTIINDNSEANQEAQQLLFNQIFEWTYVLHWDQVLSNLNSELNMKMKMEGNSSSEVAIEQSLGICHAPKGHSIRSKLIGQVLKEKTCSESCIQSEAVSDGRSIRTSFRGTWKKAILASLHPQNHPRVLGDLQSRMEN